LNTIVLHLSPLIFPSQISLNLSHFYLKISNNYSVLLHQLALCRMIWPLIMDGRLAYMKVYCGFHSP